MSLAKKAIVTVLPGQAAQAARAESHLCPPVVITTTPPPTSSGGASGCYAMPIYAPVPTGPPDAQGVYHMFTYQLVRYQTVCYA